MCENCNWEDIVDRIDEMLGSENYDWAEDTLSGIQATMMEMEHATDRQSAAIDNIEDARRDY